MPVSEEYVESLEETIRELRVERNEWKTAATNLAEQVRKHPDVEFPDSAVILAAGIMIHQQNE